MTYASRREFLRTAAGAALAGGFLELAGPTALAAARRPYVGEGGMMGIERRTLGKTGMDVSVLGFGGAEIGFEKTDQEAVERLLKSALDGGLNTIDTAECYAGSEEAIGKAVSDRRKDYWLFTKVGHADPGAEGWTAPSIQRSIERSLQRLKTDHVDLVHLHSCSKETLEKGECIEALEKAKKAGKTRFIGYSGDAEPARYAVETGRFDTLETSISIADQQAIELTLPLAREQKMGVIAKRPIANAAWRYDTEPGNGYVVEYWKRLQKLNYDFAKGEKRADPGPEGAAGVALRFTLSQPGVHTAIVGTTKPERWKQNAELVAAGPLPKERVEEIRRRWKEIAEEGWAGQV
jgi:aryl-alcohol dehydrogenase-like predicted oxidoreductase